MFLRNLLRNGTELANSCTDRKWDALWNELLQAVGDEKVVLFAQPIETVTSLATYLQNRTGRAPALIIGTKVTKSVNVMWRRFGVQTARSSWSLPAPAAKASIFKSRGD